MDLKLPDFKSEDEEFESLATHDSSENMRQKYIQLEDAEDVLDLEKAIAEEKHIPGFSLEEVKKALDVQ